MKKYKRVLLKIGGEVFGGEKGKGISIPSYMKIAKEITEIKKENDIDLCLVLGGGNIFRGREAGNEDFEMAVAHQMGMVSTVINGLGLEEAFDRLGVSARVMSAIKMDSVCEPFLKEKSPRSFE
jgi:uridylate kinase